MLGRLRHSSKIRTHESIQCNGVYSWWNCPSSERASLILTCNNDVQPQNRSSWMAMTFLGSIFIESRVVQFINSRCPSSTRLRSAQLPIMMCIPEMHHPLWRWHWMEFWWSAVTYNFRTHKFQSCAGFHWAQPQPSLCIHRMHVAEYAKPTDGWKRESHFWKPWHPFCR